MSGPDVTFLRERLVPALRSGEYLQGKHHLRAIHVVGLEPDEFNADPRRWLFDQTGIERDCCLGVASILWIEDHPDEPWVWEQRGIGFNLVNRQTAEVENEESEVLPPAMAEAIFGHRWNDQGFELSSTFIRGLVDSGRLSLTSEAKSYLLSSSPPRLMTMAQLNDNGFTFENIATIVEEWLAALADADAAQQGVTA